MHSYYTYTLSSQGQGAKIFGGVCTRGVADNLQPQPTQMEGSQRSKCASPVTSSSFRCQGDFIRLAVGTSLNLPPYHGQHRPRGSFLGRSPTSSLALARHDMTPAKGQGLTTARTTMIPPLFLQPPSPQGDT